MSETLTTIPLSKLRRTSDNIRKTNATGDLEELAASISALGVLQNLTVRPVAKSGKMKAGFEVVAGGRRLAALKMLARKKRIAGSYPVPCRILSTKSLTAPTKSADASAHSPIKP